MRKASKRLLTIVMAAAITMSLIFGMPAGIPGIADTAQAKSAGYRVVMTKEYYRGSVKDKFEKIREFKYKKTGELIRFKYFFGKITINYYYGGKRRLTRAKETGKSPDKFTYSNKGRTVTKGSYNKSKKKYILEERYVFTKTGRLKEYRNLVDGVRYTFKYKKGKMTEMRHYDWKGRLWLKSTAKYNKRGWLTRITNTSYRNRFGEKNKKPLKYAAVKLKYKVKKNKIYRYGKYKDYEFGGYEKYNQQYNRKYKVKDSLHLDPFEMPYLTVKDYDDKYKYKFYKSGSAKGRVKIEKKYRGGSIDEIKYKYKRVKLSLRRARIQHYLTRGFEPHVMYADPDLYYDLAKD